MSEAPQALLNGAPAPDLAFSRGLHYGDGVFRTFLKFHSQIVDFKLQYRKFSEDAESLGLEPPATELLLAEAASVSAAATSGVLKILLVRAGAGRGYRPETAETDRLMFCYPLPEDPPECWSRGIEAFRCGLRLGRQPALAGVKHLNRLEQVLASRDWPAGAARRASCATSGELRYAARAAICSGCRADACIRRRWMAAAWQG